jgi:hypothetical protein
MTDTYWNGEPCKARLVEVTVGKAPRSTWWCADMAGTRRKAVEVEYGGTKFYLDNEDGTGWRKVTEGRGAPNYYHASIPVDDVPHVTATGEVTL